MAQTWKETSWWGKVLGVYMIASFALYALRLVALFTVGEAFFNLPPLCYYIAAPGAVIALIVVMG